jgi:hypothetical protein
MESETFAHLDDCHPLNVHDFITAAQRGHGNLATAEAPTKAGSDPRFTRAEGQAFGFNKNRLKR